jgi:ABC-type sugar transport system ATPase subunit
MLYVTHDQAEAMTLGNRVVVMQGGRLQQIDSPLNIYRRPANEFVAAYSGNPPMNFFAGDVQEGTFCMRGCSIDIGRGIPDGPATLGVRPEDLLPASNGLSLGMVTLELVESAGYETIAHFALTGSRHAVRLPTDDLFKSGDQLQLSIRPGRFHLFALDGRRLN